MRYPKTFSSYMLATVIKVKYQAIRITPYFLSNFQPLKCVAATRNTTVEKRDKVEYVKPEKTKCTSFVKDLRSVFTFTYDFNLRSWFNDGRFDEPWKS